MTRYLARRLFHSVFVLLGLIVAIFFVTRTVGDPAKLMLPLEASQEQYLTLRRNLDMDNPLHLQFVHFATAVSRGDFGDSSWKAVPALPLVLQRVPATLYLSAVTLLIALPLAVALGAISAFRPRSLVDRAVTILSLAGICIAHFWLGLMLIMLFAVQLGWFYTSGYGGWEYVALPALSLAARPIGRVSQVVRSSMLEEMGKPYVVTARAKGLRERMVVFLHVLKNAAIPIVTMTGDEAATLLHGQVVIETVFSWPGVGALLMEAISWRDLHLLEANVFVIAVMLILVNLIVDISYVYLNPEVRYS